LHDDAIGKSDRRANRLHAESVAQHLRFGKKSTRFCRPRQKRLSGDALRIRPLRNVFAKTVQAILKPHQVHRHSPLTPICPKAIGLFYKQALCRFFNPRGGTQVQPAGTFLNLAKSAHFAPALAAN
jgi:hypothetical protein